MPAHVFSVDVEDWYQGIEIPMRRWNGFEQRVEQSMGALLDLMARHGVRATCFVLGRVAEEHPRLIRRIHAAGHEIATHGYSHTKIYDLSPRRFRRELRRSIGLLQNLTGEAVLGHRAPYFSITEESRWALGVMAEEGLRYDSSIHPVFNYRYGIPNADRLASAISSGRGHALLEVPVSTVPLPGVNVPAGGGAYLRIYPYWLQRTLLRRLQRRGERIGLYVHPWELDPGHPRLDLPFRVGATHYFNLTSTRPKLEKLFREFTFRPYREVFNSELEAITA